MLAKIVLALIN